MGVEEWDGLIEQEDDREDQETMLGTERKVLRVRRHQGQWHHHFVD